MEHLLPFERRTFEIIVKKSAKSDPKFGKSPSDRAVEELMHYGIINLNKPKGPSSHQVADMLKKVIGITKSGHSGTLDPAVTGVLPVALGRATRITQALLPAGKEYVALMHLHDSIDEQKMRVAFNEFLGRITQLPPVRSAVKRVSREREVYYADILEIQDRFVLFTFGCQAGTYVRKWIHDLGERLGVGAHMAQLTRTKAGPFSFDRSWTLQDVEDALWYYRTQNNDKFIRAVIQPMESALVHLPRIWVFDSAIESLAHGQDLAVPGISQVTSGILPQELVAIMSLKGELVAFGESQLATQEMLSLEHGVAAKTQKVFMEPSTYPSSKKSS